MRQSYSVEELNKHFPVAEQPRCRCCKAPLDLIEEARDIITWAFQDGAYKQVLTRAKKPPSCAACGIPNKDAATKAMKWPVEFESPILRPWLKQEISRDYDEWA